MKVLHLIGGMNVGGTETMLMNLYRRVNKNVEFHFISFIKAEGYYDDEINRLGGKVIKMKSPSELGIINTIKEIRKIIKDNGEYDAIHCHTLFNCGLGVIAAYLEGIKVRISHSHTTLEKTIGIKRKVYLLLMKRFIRLFSTDYLSCSDAAGAYLFGKRILKSENYKVLPNYINYNELINCSKGSFRSEIGLKEDDIVIGHVGRVVEAKNHGFIIDVIEECSKLNKKVKGLLVGDGELKEEILLKIKEKSLEDNIVFLGIREDINRIIKNMDLFIFPSIYEGLGMVALEAQAAGVPVLASENIQREADIGIGMIKWLHLEKGSKEWSKIALSMITMNKPDNNTIEKAFHKKGYKVESIIENLINIYGRCPN